MPSGSGSSWDFLRHAARRSRCISVMESVSSIITDFSYKVRERASERDCGHGWRKRRRCIRTNQIGDVAIACQKAWVGLWNFRRLLQYLTFSECLSFVFTVCECNKSSIILYVKIHCFEISKWLSKAQHLSKYLLLQSSIVLINDACEYINIISIINPWRQNVI